MTLIVPGGPTPIMYFVIFSSKTAFFKFEDLFPECFLYREQSPQLEPLICLREDNACHVGKNCMEVLAKRLHALFGEVLKGVDLLILYYRKRSTPDSLGAGLFWRSMESPRTVTLNRRAWGLIKSRGAVFQFEPGDSFFLTGNSAPPETPENTEEVVLD